MVPLGGSGVSNSPSSTRARFEAGEGASTMSSSGSRACRLDMMMISWSALHGRRSRIGREDDENPSWMKLLYLEVSRGSCDRRLESCAKAKLEAAKARDGRQAWRCFRGSELHAAGALAKKFASRQAPPKLPHVSIDTLLSLTITWSRHGKLIHMLQVHRSFADMSFSRTRTPPRSLRRTLRKRRARMRVSRPLWALLPSVTW